MVHSAHSARSTARHTGRITAVVLALGALAFESTSLAQRAAAATPAPRPVAAGLEIKLFRPIAVGRRLRYVAAGEQHSHLELHRGAAVLKNENEDLIVRMDAVLKVLAVDAAGQAIQEEYTVTKFETGPANSPTVLVPAGQVITVVRGEGAAHGVVTVNGQPADPNVIKALKVVASTQHSALTDDGAFGTAQRQAVGATWPMNATAAARDLASSRGMQATLSGATRLVARAPFQGVDCQEIATHMTGNVTSIAELPPGSVVNSGQFTGNFHGMFPIDTSKAQLQSGMDMDISMDVTVPARGQTVHLQMTSREVKSVTFTPL